MNYPLQTLAVLIKERIEKIPGLEGRVAVNDGSFESQIENALKRLRGRCAEVRLVKRINTSKTKASNFHGNFVVRVVSHAISDRASAATAEEIDGQIEKRISGWWPEEQIPSNGCVWCHIPNIDHEPTTLESGTKVNVSIFYIQAPRIKS